MWLKSKSITLLDSGGMQVIGMAGNYLTRHIESYVQKVISLAQDRNLSIILNGFERNSKIIYETQNRGSPSLFD